jgi:cell wall-associated NlpC family hydrolase
LRARGRHVKPSRLKNVSYTVGLSTAVAVPLGGFTASPAAAHPVAPRAVSPAAAPAAPVAVSAASSNPTLRQGARGPAVVDLQQRLGGLSADGVFGPVTRGAVVSFQSGRGLVADGIVGPITWGALNGSAVVVRASRSVERTVEVRASVAGLSVGSSVGAAAVAEAARHVGKPYRYGATGPGSFDCSGFVQYVYRQVGVSLPRTSAQQAAAARPVPRGSEQLGDLIIFRTGGTVTHLGIYAGDGTMWVARRTGTTVTRQTIYTSTYSVGRVT